MIAVMAEVLMTLRSFILKSILSARLYQIGCQPAKSDRLVV